MFKVHLVMQGQLTKLLEARDQVSCWAHSVFSRELIFVLLDCEELLVHNQVKVIQSSNSFYLIVGISVVSH